MGINVELAIKFHFRKWKGCFVWSDGDVVYIYLFFSANDVYQSFYQVRLDNGVVSRSHALMSGSILHVLA